MFQIAAEEFDCYLDIKEDIDDNLFSADRIQYFDNDGFELSYLEQEYYIKNNIKLSNILNHSGDQKIWIKSDSNLFKIDHSMLLQRWEFVNHSRSQIKAHSRTFPQLNKYLMLKSKWGLDFALEYFNEDIALEVMHIETDSYNYYEILGLKQFYEEKILSTDWNCFVNYLLKNKHCWEGLQGLEQNDWKASQWGIKKAEKIIKAFKQ